MTNSSETNLLVAVMRTAHREGDLQLACEFAKFLFDARHTDCVAKNDFSVVLSLIGK